MIELEIDDVDGHRHVLTCEAVLLDMDGTLVDSGDCVESTWRAWAERHGIDPQAILAISHGRQNQAIVRLVAPRLDLPEEYEAMVRAEEACTDGVAAIPGASELLAALPSGRWAVVTSAWHRLAEIRMGLAGLPLPDVLITSELTTRSKPDPEGYLAAAAGLGVGPEACVVVEDAPAGIEAGRAAGMRVIALTTTFAREQLDAEWRVADLHAIRLRTTPT